MEAGLATDLITMLEDGMCSGLIAAWDCSGLRVSLFEHPFYAFNCGRAPRLVPSGPDVDGIGGAVQARQAI